METLALIFLSLEELKWSTWKHGEKGMSKKKEKLCGNKL